MARDDRVRRVSGANPRPAIRGLPDLPELREHVLRLLPMELPIILSPGEDGYVVAECPVIPGCISQGKTRDEALRNIREAIELCLENRLNEGWQLPEGYEIVQVSVGE